MSPGVQRWTGLDTGMLGAEVDRSGHGHAGGREV